MKTTTDAMHIVKSVCSECSFKYEMTGPNCNELEKYATLIGREHDARHAPARDDAASE